jgi:hypothetical protein
MALYRRQQHGQRQVFVDGVHCLNCAGVMGVKWVLGGHCFSIASLLSSARSCSFCRFLVQTLDPSDVREAVRVAGEGYESPIGIRVWNQAGKNVPLTDTVTLLGVELRLRLTGSYGYFKILPGRNFLMCTNKGRSDPLWRCLALTPTGAMAARPLWAHPFNIDFCARVPTILQWIENCLHGHRGCKFDTGLTFEAPARFIHVGNPTEMEKLRLVDGASLAERARYITLSHCWGGHIPLRTVRSNVKQLEVSMTLSDLPRTFRDAVMVTRALGIQFLWIDCLRIVQDDDAD